MTGGGEPTRFGYFLVPNADAPLLATAQRVEQLGLDYVGVQDHPYQRRYVETWSLLGILATTTRLTVFPDVANLPLRPPAMLAKAPATLDVLSGGRRVGLGVTPFESVAGYRPFPDPDEQTDLGRWPQLEVEAYALPSEVPDALAKPIWACLEPEPDNRPRVDDSPNCWTRSSLPSRVNRF